MPFEVQMQVAGLGDLIKQLDQFKDRVKKKILRTAVTKATRVLRKEARRLAPKETGLLRKSLGAKVKTYDSGVVVGIVGPQKGFKRTVAIKPGRVYRIVKGRVVKIAKPKPEQLSMERNPIPYAHLVERGFTRADGRQIPARSFIRKALSNKRSEVEALMRAEISRGIEEALRK